MSGWGIWIGIHMQQWENLTRNIQWTEKQGKKTNLWCSEIEKGGSFNKFRWEKWLLFRFKVNTALYNCKGALQDIIWEQNSVLIHKILKATKRLLIELFQIVCIWVFATFSQLRLISKLKPHWEGSVLKKWIEQMKILWKRILESH